MSKFNISFKGKKYSIDKSLLASEIASLEAVLSGLSSSGDDSGDDPGSSYALAPGLYRTGAIEMCESGDVDGAQAMLETSWDELVNKGEVVIRDGAVSVGVPMPELPEMNEYGFYFGVPYTLSEFFVSLIFYEDGSLYYSDPTGQTMLPAGTAQYGAGAVSMSSVGFPDGTFSSDGLQLYCMGTFVIGGSVAELNGDLVLPNDGTVTAVDNSIFHENFGMYVSGFGFANTSITGIYLPNSIVNIGESAFGSCSKLGSVIIRNGVTSIGCYAFVNCSSLVSIVIPDGITTISDSAFSGCSNLSDVVIGDDVTSIGCHAFSHCSSLVSIVIPDGVTTIGNNAFFDCSSLTGIDIPNGVTLIDFAAFAGCSSLVSIVIPDGITTISDSAFSGCSNLSDVVIGDDVTSIGKDVFSGDKFLNEIIFNGTMTQWNAISKDINWNYEVPATYVQCSDGQVTL